MVYYYPQTCSVCGLEQTVIVYQNYGSVCPDCLVSSRDYVVEVIKDHRLKIVTQYGVGSPKIRGPYKTRRYDYDTKKFDEIPEAEVTDPQQPKE